MASSLRAFALLAAIAGASAARQNAAIAINPMRRVISMLQMMQKKVTEEGKKEAELFERYQCYCKSGSGDLGKSISAAEGKIPKVESGLQESEGLKKQLESQLAEHKADRADAKDAVAKATALREKEAAAYAKESSDDKTNIAALGKAIAAIEAGIAGSFLQSAAAATVRQLAISVEMGSADRDMLSAFLSNGEGYVPKSGQIVGILKQMKDTMEKELAEITATEEQAIKDFEALVAAKEKEIKANTAAIESKLDRVGELGVEIVALKEDLDDTSKALLEDKKFLADLEEGCSKKQAEWDERSKTRTAELLALADTIKILNDDDSLELFKATLPSPALLQTQVTGAEVRRRALAALRASGKGGKVSLVALALSGHSSSFEKVTKMIDEMVALLGKEQSADDEKKAFCEAELDKAEDNKKGLDQAVADLEKAIDDANGKIATLTEEIQALADGIKALDKEVAEATEMRKAENKEYTETMAANGAAKKLIGIAVNRLAQFYTPKLYKAPAKRELSAADRVVENMGGDVAPAPAPGGIAGTGVEYLQGSAVFAQVAAHSTAAAVRSHRVAPEAPPETWGAYQKKGEEHTGVVELLKMLAADLDKEIQEMTVDEKDSQAEYEAFTADSAAKRATDAKSIAEKEGVKADLEAAVQKMGAEKKATSMEAMAAAEYIHSLHADCDWLLANFEARKAARAGEVDSLKNAKAVLSGADYSLVQTGESAGRVHLRGVA